MSKRFGQDFEVEVQARFLSWSFVSFAAGLLYRFSYGRHSEARFGQYFEF